MSDEHLGRLMNEFGARVRVIDCLMQLSSRLAEEPTLRRSPDRMPTFVRNWLRKDATDINEFAVGGAPNGERVAKAQAKRADGDRADLEKRAADLLGTPAGKRGAA
jgi:hypothetical protein